MKHRLGPVDVRERAHCSRMALMEFDGAEIQARPRQSSARSLETAVTHLKILIVVLDIPVHTIYSASYLFTLRV